LTGILEKTPVEYLIEAPWGLFEIFLHKCGNYFGSSNLVLMLGNSHAKASCVVHGIVHQLSLEEIGVVKPSPFLIYFSFGIFICIFFLIE